MNEELDYMETLIASLLCADSLNERDAATGNIRNTSNGAYEELHCGVRLAFDPMFPSKSYTTQLGCHIEGTDTDRLYTDDSALLRNSTQDVIGKSAEIAIVGDGTISWLGFRRIHRTPKNVWVGSPGATLYQVHQRCVMPNGNSVYHKNIAAISKTGKPVPCTVVGTKGSGGMVGSHVVIAASVIEDAHRSGVLTAEVADSAGIVFPVPLGEHKDLFALRDAPLTPAGRRKAILHWVSSHIRGNSVEVQKVKAHWRGARDLVIGGMSVKLSTND